MCRPERHPLDGTFLFGWFPLVILPRRSGRFHWTHSKTKSQTIERACSGDMNIQASTTHLIYLMETLKPWIPQCLCESLYRTVLCWMPSGSRWAAVTIRTGDLAYN